MCRYLCFREKNRTPKNRGAGLQVLVNHYHADILSGAKEFLLNF